jgi:hypothetical protein
LTRWSCGSPACAPAGGGWTWPRPPGGPDLAGAIPQFNPDYLALGNKVDTGQRQAMVEFSFIAGGRPAGAADQARGWWAATMVAFVMAAFCCACDDRFILLADGLLDACGICGAASVLSGSGTPVR